MTDTAQFRFLMDKLISDTLTEEERGALTAMIREPDYENELHQYLQQSFHAAEEEKGSPEWTDRFIGQVTEKIQRRAPFLPGEAELFHPQNEGQHLPETVIQSSTRKFSVIIFSRRAAAAAILLFALAGTAYLVFNRKTTGPLSQQERFKNDILPGGNKALLQLSDGSTITLDDARNGSLATQGGASITKKGGSLIYGKGVSVVYNTMITQVKGQYQLSLPDGTKVWLDASSSIHFPTSFPGNKREVEVTGQVYFEVTKNPTQPFRVKVKDQIIEVLGTDFNINAYNNEQSIKTTLVDGAVKIASNSKTLLLQPGQQAQTKTDGNIQLVTDPDLEETLGWKNGMFRYNGARIQTIMNQVARWYGVQIVYRDHIEGEFVAKIPREVPVSKLLSLLEATGAVHFIIEDKTITVMK